MKHLYFLIILLASALGTQAQGGVWTWMKGDSTINTGVQMGNYGTLGVPSPLNEPPGRYNPNYWTDTQGNFWLGFGQILNVGHLNDLWKYDVATNEWTWMKGPQVVTNTAGVFGVQGVADTANYPSSGNLSGYNWTDANNNLWLYHSWGDVWKFSIATNNWTWMKGSGVLMQPAVFGVQGVPNAANTPGYHNEYKCCWTDASDNLWLYLDGNMWKYDVVTNMWTWIKGPGAAMPVANYGTQGVASATNQPNLNQSWEYWKDRDGNFYMGHGSYNSSAIWKFDPITTMWTWISGVSVIPSGTGASYISQCEASTNRHPGKRIEGRGSNYLNNNLCEDYMWFCGGSSFGMFNDLWCYRPLHNTWTWISGDSVAGSANSFGNYGIKGVPAATNVLPRRQGHAMWVDSNQQVWVFGGIVRSGSSRGNDLWRFTPDASCFGYQVDSSVLLPPTDTALCKSQSSTMVLDTTLSISILPAGSYVFNADSSAVTFTPNTTTTYTVTGTKSVNNCSVSKTIEFTLYVNEYFMPSFADTSICDGESYSIPLDTSYQFTFTPTAFQYTVGDSIAIFNALTTTQYTVTATKNNCPVTDTATFTIHIEPSPIASFNLMPQSVSISSAQFMLNNQSQHSVSYNWFVNNQLIDTNANTSYWATDTGEVCFTLYASNEVGCVDSIVHCGVVYPDYMIIIPNVFSPNGNGLNDIFRILGKNIHLKKFIIYNRWGEEIFGTKEITKGWDGSFRGKLAEIGVYFYYIEFTNLLGEKFIRKGDVSLIR